MKKSLFIFLILAFGTFVFASPLPQENSSENAGMKDEVLSTTEPEYMTHQSGDSTFYYDKYGKLIARDKKIQDKRFFYNKVGQMVGKSVEINKKTYYYNQLSKFLGVCDENNNCVDKDFVSTGKIPPLPAIKNFVPVYDDNILNPQAKTTSEDDE